MWFLLCCQCRDWSIVAQIFPSPNQPEKVLRQSPDSWWLQPFPTACSEGLSLQSLNRERTFLRERLDCRDIWIHFWNNIPLLDESYLRTAQNPLINSHWQSKELYSFQSNSIVHLAMRIGCHSLMEFCNESGNRSKFRTVGFKKKLLKVLNVLKLLTDKFFRREENTERKF